MSSDTTPDKPSFMGHYRDFISEDNCHYPNNKELLSIGSPIGKKLGLRKIGIHVDILPPGRRTSWPHAESHEEEFVFVLEGNPDAWIDGHLHPLEPGMLVAFPAGTGIAHTFLNNTSKNCLLLVGGEQDMPSNQTSYPLHPERQSTDNYWHSAPKRPLGAHDGLPEQQR